MWRMWSAVVVSLALTAAFAVAPAAAGLTVREWGVRGAGGVSPETEIRYYGLHPFVSFSLWESADSWFTKHGLTTYWVIEPWVAYLDDNRGPNQEESFELGVSALFFRMYIRDWTLRPFIEGGEGILYNGLDRQELGSKFQFSSQLGAGLEWSLRRDLSLTIAARIRHVSNANLGNGNPGLNHVIGLVGLTFR